MQILDKRKALAIAPLLRLAFRGFFLLGSVFAVIAVPLWIAAFKGTFLHWQPVGGWLAWHQHEMLFGFTSAIIAGFLLTAVQTWTGQPSLSGKPLLLLIMVWLLARLSWFLAMPAPLLLALNLLFLLLVTVNMARLLWAVRQVRNYPIVLILSLLMLAEALNLSGVILQSPELQRRGVLAAAWLVAALITLIGGRVIPFFTQKGLGRKEPLSPWPWLDWFLLIGMLLIALLEAGGVGLQAHGWIGQLFLLLALAHLIRLVRWFDAGVFKVALLWSLHLAYGWLIVACAGMALWHFNVLSSPSPALHALTVGCIGGLILAMLSRVSLGHTGRPLVLPKGFWLAFVCLNLGAVARVFGVGGWYMPALGVGALFWSLAFAQYVWCYGPMLCKGRADGHPG
ncbi:MAG: short-chain dehydrogenase [Pseudomonadaceae bacterium]|nr:short-chain dehydrogenase [Pseudomonadaceae bacterium]